ncbi:MAG: molybdopterin guanine dinucleotide synthesis [Silicimonas sp.]|nr:molybdopterin guanine dinucleotide synthesis [Silicimonas sp.]
MSGWDSFVMVDWSSGNDRGPTPKKDAIWIGAVLAGCECEPVYQRNRQIAEATLAALIEDELRSGRRLMIGFDFPFGYPEGFAHHVVSRPDPLALWDWFAAHLFDTPEANNRFDLAGRLNHLFPGIGPFWFNGLKRDIPDLPHKGTDRRDHGMPERRHAEAQAKGTFPLWQMGGAGAVGGQAMTGMATLSRLRARFLGTISVWPFEPLNTRVAFVEIWPSLIGRQVALQADAIKDCAQVRCLARAMSRLQPAELDRMLDVAAPEEGWIMGLGFESLLEGAVCPA